MNIKNVNFIKVIDDSRTSDNGYIDPILPKYSTSESSGFDFYSINDICLKANDPVLAHTGWRVELPDINETFSSEMQIRPRSGLALKEGISVLNTPGTIDKDYRGEIGIILYWNGYRNPKSSFNIGRCEIDYNVEEFIIIPAGTRIAQGVICPVYKANILLSNDFEISETERKGGFGSTGIS